MEAVINGVKMAYTDEGHGTPVVLVHGYPLSRALWAPQVAALRSTYRVIAPDLRGFGDSAADGGTNNGLSQYALDLASLLDHLKVGQVVLAGHSIGGYIALAFARESLGRLRGLMLVSTRPGADSTEAANNRRTLAERVGKEGVQPVVDSMAPKIISAHSQTQKPNLMEQVQGIMRGASPEGVILALHAMASRDDSTMLLPTLKIPTLVLAGEADLLVPPDESRKMAEVIPDARLTLIPQVGHLPSLEAPEAVNQAMAEFLAGAEL